jgi:hypothetical protein
MRFLASLVLLLAGAAQAATLDLGNVAPGSGAVQLAFAGQPSSPALGYLQFVRVDRPLGRLEVTAIGAGDHVLAQGVFEFESAPDVDAMLVLVGNGSAATPYRLRLYDGIRDADVADKTRVAAIALHHLAPYPGAPAQAGFEALVQCASVSPATGGGGSFGLRVLRYDESATQVFRGDAVVTCSVKTGNPSFGSFDIPVNVTDGTLRFLLVGDGQYEPQRILVLHDGTVLRVAEESAPAVGAVTRSEDFWYDLARPAQGVSLYELPNSDDAFGTWFTHDEAGQPIWYFFDGTATAVPGQRELVVYRPSRGASGTSLAVAGSARLFYLDCNQAELRVLLGERDYFTLRLQRSREVPACDALD